MGEKIQIGSPDTAPHFSFRQCTKLLKATGAKARDLKELKDLITAASDDTIRHHTFDYFFKGHLLEYTNDFAQWVGQTLEVRPLAEVLSNIDPYRHASVAELRNSLAGAVEDYIESFPESGAVLPGEEFFFQESVTLAFTAGLRAGNLAEFLMALRYVDATCIYYHFYEARVRVAEGTDDFSKWVAEVLGKEGLAKKIRSIDPFMHSIEGIREKLIGQIEEELRKEIEVTAE